MAYVYVFELCIPEMEYPSVFAFYQSPCLVLIGHLFIHNDPVSTIHWQRFFFSLGVPTVVASISSQRFFVP